MSWYKPWEMMDEMLDGLPDYDEYEKRKKRRKKNTNNYANMGHSYILEYSKSSRASCKVCTVKIQKNEIRVGKNVEMKFTGGYFDENTLNTMAPVWFHAACFWGPSYYSKKDDLNKSVLRNYVGFELLKVKDQEEIHVKITGHAMSDEMIEDAVLAEAEKEEEVRKNGVFVDSDPFVIAESLVEKWLFNVPKADEVKELVKMSGLTVKGKAKKADLQNLLYKQKIHKIPEVVKRSLNKYLTAADLKQILKPLNLKTSGNKGDQIGRLVTYLQENFKSCPKRSGEEEELVQTTIKPAQAKEITHPVITNISRTSIDDGEKDISIIDVVNISQEEDKRQDALESDKENTAPVSPSKITSPLQKLQIQSSTETLIRAHVKSFCTQYLRNQDLKGNLDELSVNRKGITKKADLVKLLVSQDLALMPELVTDSLIEFASQEDLEALCEEFGVKESNFLVRTVENIVAVLSSNPT